MYPIVDGSTRAGKAVYAVLSGLTHKIKAGYGVIDGVHRQFYSAGPKVAFSGTHTISDLEIDGAAYKLYTLTGSGTLSVNGNGIRYWMCGGGAGGGAYASDRRAGGGGGYVISGTIPIGTYTVAIGAGGNVLKNGGSTSVGTYMANGGNGRDGGSGGGGDGTGAGVSTYPFGLADLKAHCPGGGSGGGRNPISSDKTLYIPGSYGGTNGGNGEAFSNRSYYGSSYGIGGDGGEYGGGRGESCFGTDGTAATFYGGGGGGGGLNREVDTIFGGRAGYQGVAYVLVPAA